MRNFLTIDVEEYFQVSGFTNVVTFDNWRKMECRLEIGLHKILEMLDDVKSTFFILGWVAENKPDLVKKIAQTGNEIATHGRFHRFVNSLSPEEFRADLNYAKKQLEDLIGIPVIGHRAPSFSITKEIPWAFEVLAEIGFKYDSSVYPIKRRLGGIAGESVRPYKITTNSGDLWEFPLAVTSILGRKLPVAGGGFFRLYPYWFTKRAIASLNCQGIPVVVYLHPWEFDPQQPRLKSRYSINGFNHYINLEKAEVKFQKLLKDFSFTSFESYLDISNLKLFS
jgi:polysaccharide deacetylase family protein (PEP-CTERM system associated)